MRRKTLLLICLLGSAMLVAWCILKPVFFPGEPSYEGRTFRQWVDEYHRAYHPTADRERIDKAKKAFVAMGTNSFPILIKWLSKDYPKATEFFHRNDSSTAMAIFNLMGERAKAALPDLIMLTRNKDAEVRYRALIVIIELKPDRQTLVPLLTVLTRDPDSNVRFLAAENLAAFPEEAEKAGVFSMYPVLLGGVVTNDVTNK